MSSTNYLINAQKLEAFLIQIIEQPHTQRRLVIAAFPAPHEHETPPQFFFADKIDPDLVVHLREAIINTYQQQITRDLTRHHGLITELKAREKELEKEQSQQDKNQLDLFQIAADANNVFLNSAGTANNEIAPF